MADAVTDVDTLLAAWSRRAGDEEAAWARTVEGPALDAVASRLSGVPQPFLDPRVDLAALAGDVLPGLPLACVEYAADDRVRTGGAIGLWLVASEDLIETFAPSLRAGAVDVGVDALALRVAPTADPRGWLVDDERRVEAVRTLLLWSGFRPAGEAAPTARALLASCDSLARDAALARAYEGHRHRAEIARRLEAARAREAAARYSAE